LEREYGAGIERLPLDIGSRAVILLVETVAGNCLSITLWTTLHIAANDVIFPLNHSAIMTRTLIRAPII
jgi:hypothetical protein